MGMTTTMCETEAAVLPLPAVLDTPAVVLLHLLMGGGRPVVLDASAVYEVEANALEWMEALLLGLHTGETPVRIENAGAALRARLEGRPLAALLDEPRRAWVDEEALFLCPDREVVGFQPSAR